jgi:hypothetical protein
MADRPHRAVLCNPLAVALTVLRPKCGVPVNTWA